MIARFMKVAPARETLHARADLPVGEY